MVCGARISLDPQKKGAVLPKFKFPRAIKHDLAPERFASFGIKFQISYKIIGVCSGVSHALRPQRQGAQILEYGGQLQVAIVRTGWSVRHVLLC